MIGWLSTAIIVLGVAIGLYATVLAVRRRGIDDPLLITVVVLELLLIVQTVSGLVSLASLDRDIDTASFVGYLVGCVLLPPVAVLWALAERSRWGSAVLAVLGPTIAVMTVRLLQIWDGTGV
jgi:hypothetical protein